MNHPTSNHPTSNQLRKVVLNFDKAISLAKVDAPVNMQSTSIAYEDNICGTPMCHAGWYLISVKAGAMREWARDNSDRWDFPTYIDGVGALSKDLGFTTRHQLVYYYEARPELWGNDCGIEMFSSESAFFTEDESYYEGKLTLSVIRNWWAGVHNRTFPDQDPIQEI